MMDESECRSWRSAADLFTADACARVALLGAPLTERSLTPGRCDLAPKVLRASLARMSVYDVETGTDLSSCAVFDAGDLDLKLVAPADAFESVRARLTALTGAHELTLLVGGNNAVTRPAVHGLDPSLKSVGLLTLDAHFDLRDTDCGLNNGNPVQALLEDGLAGARIAQLGLSAFANTRRAHEKAKAAEIHVRTISQLRADPLGCVGEALAALAARCERIHVDFDIDVIDRAQCPGAPGARPGGLAAHDFFASARLIAAHPKVRSVDLTEFDPSLDVADVTALTAARWFVEVLAGFFARPR